MELMGSGHRTRRDQGNGVFGESEEQVGQRASFNGADGISDIEHLAIKAMEFFGETT
jgi:hypothetical protein